MRYAMVVLLTLATPACAQDVSFENLDIASELRFTASHCFALQPDWDGMKRHLRERGVPIDVFTPGGMYAAYIAAHDRESEADLRAMGANAFCKRAYIKHYGTGLFRQKTRQELDDLNGMRRGTGGDPIAPLE